MNRKEVKVYIIDILLNNVLIQLKKEAHRQRKRILGRQLLRTKNQAINQKEKMKKPLRNPMHFMKRK